MQEHEEAERDEAGKNNSVSSPFRSNPLYQAIDARYLRCCTCYATIDTGYCLALDSEVLVDGIRLGDNAIDDIVAVVDPAPFL